MTTTRFKTKPLSHPQFQVPPAGRIPGRANPEKRRIKNPRNLADYPTANRASLAQAAAGNVDPAKVIRLCARIVEDPRNSGLLHCTPRSFAVALIECLSLGIYPDMGRGYFVPSGDRVVFVLGYRGMIELAAKAGIFVRAYNVFKGQIQVGRRDRRADHPSAEHRNSPCRRDLPLLLLRFGRRRAAHLRRDAQKRDRRGAGSGGRL